MTLQANLPLTFCKDSTANLLVVEGKDDCNGIYQIAARHGLQDLFGIWEAGSDHQALERFGGLLLSSKQRPDILGIVLDCDTDEDGSVRAPIRRWAQIQQRLEKVGYVIPAEPTRSGTIIIAPEGYPKVGVWLMPDNETEGMFEDFLLPLISEEARLFAEEVTTAARAKGVGNYKEKHKSKAIAHCFLSWQDEPGKPLGVAIKARMFDVEGPKAQVFIAWLRTLFSQ